MEEIIEKLNKTELEYILHYSQYADKIKEEVYNDKKKVSSLLILKKVIDYNEENLKNLLQNRALTNHIFKGENFNIDVITYIKVRVHNKVLKIDRELREFIEANNLKHN